MRPSRPGYSLIELLISIAMISTLTAFGANAYFQSQKRQIARAATDTILNTLESAQKRALVGDKSCSGAIQGYQTQLSASSNTITLTATCSSDNETPVTISVAGITFNSDHTFTFKPLTMGIDLGGGSTSANIDYLDSFGDTHRITVTSSGTIEYLGTL